MDKNNNKNTDKKKSDKVEFGNEMDMDKQNDKQKNNK